MKIRSVFAHGLVTVLLGGCSSMKYTEFHGSQTIVGQAGTPRKVDDVDFWTDGIPSRKYQILGIISTKRKQRVPLGPLSRAFSGSGGSDDDRESAIAKIARKHGGDGVIFVRGGAGATDGDDSGGRRHGRTSIVVIKYLE